MGEPVGVVALREVLAVVAAAALLAGQGAGDDRLGAVDHAAELQGFGQVGVEAAAAVVDGDLGVGEADAVDLPLRLGHARGVADDRDLVHHHLLHRLAQLRGALALGPGEEGVDLGPRHGFRLARQRRQLVGVDVVEHVAAGAAAEDDEVDQRVSAESVGAVDADAGGLTGGVEAGDDRAALVADDPALDVGREAAHRVVGRRLDRDRLGLRLDAEVGAGEVGDVGQLLVDQLGRQVGEVEVDVILAVNAAPFLDLLVDEAGDHVAGGEVLEGGGVAFGEGLAVAVAEDAALAAGRLREEDAELVNAGRVELVELHVHQRHAAAVGDGDAVAGAGHRVRGDLVDPAEAAGGDQDRFGVDGVDLAGALFEGDAAAGLPVLGEEQVEQVVLVEEVDAVLDPLLVEGLDDHVAGAVGGVAGAADGTFAEVAGVAAEAALVDPAVGGAVEGEPHVLQLEHGVDRLAGEDLSGVLVDQVVAPLDGVEHVPLPVVFLGVAEGGADPALGGTGVGARGVELGDDGDVGLARELDRGHEPGAAGADDDRVEAVVGHRGTSRDSRSVFAKRPPRRSGDGRDDGSNPCPRRPNLSPVGRGVKRANRRNGAGTRRPVALGYRASGPPPTAEAFDIFAEVRWLQRQRAGPLSVACRLERGR